MKGGQCVYYFGCSEDRGAGQGGGGSYYKPTASQLVRTSKRKLDGQMDQELGHRQALREKQDEWMLRAT